MCVSAFPTFPTDPEEAVELGAGGLVRPNKIKTENSAQDRDSGSCPVNATAEADHAVIT